jgi:hypothetical protein
MRTTTRPTTNPALAALLRCAAYRNAHKPRSRHRNPRWQGAPTPAPLPVAAPMQPATAMPSPAPAAPATPTTPTYTPSPYAVEAPAECARGTPYRPARWLGWRRQPRWVGRPATPVGMPSMPHNGANRPRPTAPRTLPTARATGPLRPAPSMRTAVARPP